MNELLLRAFPGQVHFWSKLPRHNIWSTSGQCRVADWQVDVVGDWCSSYAIFWRRTSECTSGQREVWCIHWLFPRVWPYSDDLRWWFPIRALVLLEVCHYLIAWLGQCWLCIGFSRACRVLAEECISRPSSMIIHSMLWHFGNRALSVLADDLESKEASLSLLHYPWQTTWYIILEVLVCTGSGAWPGCPQGLHTHNALYICRKPGLPSSG